MISIADIESLDRREDRVWDKLWRAESIGRLAVAVQPNVARFERAKAVLGLSGFERSGNPERELSFGISAAAQMPKHPGGGSERWRQAMLDELAAMTAYMQLPGDYCPGMTPPGFAHGHSQGITDIFGARVEEQPDGNYFTYPFPADTALVDDIQVQPIQSSIYWNAVEWMNYVRSVVGGDVPFRNPVMTGPIDTANYLLGTTTLLEWVYTEPDTLHRLLQKVTDVIIEMMNALKEAAVVTPRAHHIACGRGGFDLCSEVRSLVSMSIYEEFEAPYLMQIGGKVGTFGAHSCGSWERTIPSILNNPYLRFMNGQIRENDLEDLCKQAHGRILLSINPSINVHDRYMWPDLESYFSHVLKTVPEDQPCEVFVSEDDLPMLARLHQEICGKQLHLPDPLLP